MPICPPYHTDSSLYPDQQDVYHDKSNCPDGRRIRQEYVKPGTANRRHCKECDKVP